MVRQSIIDIESFFLQDLHALVYEMNTENETWEWVDLKEVYINDFDNL